MSILKQKIRFPKLTGLNLTQNLSQLTVAKNPSLMPIILQLVLSRWARGASVRGPGARAIGNRAQCLCAALPPSASALVLGPTDCKRGDAPTVFAR